jgi:hypothetical protein
MESVEAIKQLVKPTLEMPETLATRLRISAAETALPKQKKAPTVIEMADSDVNVSIEKLKFGKRILNQGIDELETPSKRARSETSQQRTKQPEERQRIYQDEDELKKENKRLNNMNKWLEIEMANIRAKLEAIKYVAEPGAGASKSGGASRKSN